MPLSYAVVSCLLDQSRFLSGNGNKQHDDLAVTSMENFSMLKNTVSTVLLH